MQPNSSTSASERPRSWREWVVFASTCLVLFIPYEMLVRRAEKIYGRGRAFFSGKLSKIDELHLLSGRSSDFDVLIVGTSVAEQGIDPRLLRDLLEPGSKRPVFNGAIGGVSSLVGLELAHKFGIRPKWLLVSVSPTDFTRLAQSRGDRFRKRAEELMEGRSSESDDIRDVIESSVARNVQSVVHSVSPLRRRTVSDWVRFARSRDVGLFAFLNSEAVLDRCETCWDGYTGSIVERNTTSSVYFTTPVIGHLDVGPAPREYNVDHVPYLAELERQLVALRDSGVKVIMIRIPAPVGFRAAEEAQTMKFDETLRQMAARTNLPYFDSVMPDAFLKDPENFVDTNHMSYRGSQAYTRELAAQIKASFR